MYCKNIQPMRIMEKQTKFSQLIFGAALVTLLLLSIPLVAMQFTNDVTWGPVDFIIAGTLLFSTALSFAVVIKVNTNIVYRAAIGLALGSTLFLIWANLAVGLIGSGPNLGNLMYMGVVAVVVIGSILSRFSTGGIERAMYLTSIALVLVAVIALLADMDKYPGSSVKEIAGVNAFFAILYAVSGSLFRFVSREQSPAKSQG